MPSSGQDNLGRVRGSTQWPNRFPKSPNRRRWSVRGILHSDKMTSQDLASLVIGAAILKECL